MMRERWDLPRPAVSSSGFGTQTCGRRQERALGHPPSSVPQMSCPFAKLGLPPSASQDDVKAAYRLLGI